MYVIVVYDVEQSRVARVCRFLRRYLHWVQNSAFEGELSEAQLERMCKELNKIIKRSVDSVYVYTIPDPRWCRRRVLGIEKQPTDPIL